jgi:signal transduction histidine kinase
MAKILYVEDNAANRVLVSQVLGSVGYTVIEAVDALSGIKMAQEEEPDLILMDINIPGMDGYETATRIKSLPKLASVPIIALTARTMAGDRERALTAGCDGYISKPIDVDLLPRQVAEFLGGRRERVAVEKESIYLREYNERLADHLEQKMRELTKANGALERTSTMKTRFIDLAAHELRTPLAAVHGYLGILTAPGSPFMAQADANTQEIVDGIVIGIDRLRGIVQDMLDVTRISAGTLQLSYAPVSLSALFNKIQKDFGKMVTRRNQTLDIADVSEIPPIWADGERVIQILRNLMSNAVKYTPDGGRIELYAKVMGGQLPAPVSSGSSANHFVKITVRDSGVGIPPEQQELIFEHFHEVREIEHHSTSKTDFMGGGAGLGLPIARGVAEAHGGSLWVESEDYDPELCPGSKFHLILPFGQTPKD